MAIDPQYNTVAERIVEFREKHPEGSLQRVDLDFREFGGSAWVIYTAAAYRTPDDVKPGQGTAWEQVPGPTNFTRGSELQNAETSAWGRAIVAALAADTKKGIATADEVRNAREVDRQPYTGAADRKRQQTGGAGTSTREGSAPASPSPESGEQVTGPQLKKIGVEMSKRGLIAREAALDYVASVIGRKVGSRNDLTKREASLLIDDLSTGQGDEPPGMDDPWARPSGDDPLAGQS